MHTGYDELGQILDTLARAGLVSLHRDDGWLLTGRREHITPCASCINCLSYACRCPSGLRSPRAGRWLRATLRQARRRWTSAWLGLPAVAVVAG